jgi:hypothetical protein
MGGAGGMFAGAFPEESAAVVARDVIRVNTSISINVCNT